MDSTPPSSNLPSIQSPGDSYGVIPQFKPFTHRIDSNRYHDWPQPRQGWGVNLTQARHIDNQSFALCRYWPQSIRFDTWEYMDSFMRMPHKLNSAGQTSNGGRAKVKQDPVRFGPVTLKNAKLMYDSTFLGKKSWILLPLFMSQWHRRSFFSWTGSSLASRAVSISNAWCHRGCDGHVTNAKTQGIELTVRPASFW
jgi:hypothetical protein